ncbi:MAG: HEAT repeat domain-containing protein [Candidatus Aminicenantes bacterium]|nr:HEAT repeat domain-containing protein [Candidatus Aminicenantes bacterium]
MQIVKRAIFVVLMILLAANAALLAQEKPQGEDKAARLFQSAKDAVFSKNWRRASDLWRGFCEQFPQSQWEAEPYYWLAFSLNQAAREAGDFAKQTAMREQAMAKIEMLLERFKGSTWATDARMLRIELAEGLVKAGKAKYKKFITAGAQAENGSGFDVKLAALDALLQMDEEKALPILKKIIREHKDKNIRAKALFVLSQHDDPSVAPLLGEIARKDADPYVREQAIFWLGQCGEGLGVLIELYSESLEKKLKEKILFGFSQNDDRRSFDKLLQIAKSDPDPELREKALFWIGQSDDPQAPAALMEMFKANSDFELKKKIIFSLGQLDSDKGAAFLKEIAIGKYEDRLREEAVFWIGQRGGDESADMLMSFYKGDANVSFKEKTLFSLSQNDSAAALKHLLAIARSEKNPELRKKAIFWLGQSDSAEAANYLQQLIEKE